MKRLSGRSFRSVLLQLCIIIAFLLSAGFATRANTINHSKPDEPSVIGRWDITISKDGKEVPSWLEVTLSGYSTLVGRFVAEGGSARPIAEVHFKDGKMSFSIPKQWERGDNDLIVEGILNGDQLSGTLTEPDGKSYNWTGVRAPLLKRAVPPVWGTPIKLFNGKDLNGWHTEGDNQWQAIDGILRSSKSGSHIITDRTFTDFKLHIEFRYPKGSNSGVYLRGRYEAQIEDGRGLEPDSHYIGGIYGFLTPNEMAAKDPGEWQSYDITLVGRIVTVILNGKGIIVNQQIPGITGGAIDSKEGEPGPILLQGDHGPIDFRNIVITPAK